MEATAGSSHWIIEQRPVTSSDADAEPPLRAVRRQVRFVPALLKIFDEILVNAADNFQRDRSMTTIRVDIRPDEGTITCVSR